MTFVRDEESYEDGWKDFITDRDKKKNTEDKTILVNFHL